MPLSLRTGGAKRNAGVIRMRVGGATRVVSKISIRSGGVMRIGYSGSVDASISPPAEATATLQSTSTGVFTLIVNDGSPTDIVWSAPGGAIVSGQGTTSVQVSVTDSDRTDDTPNEVTISCTFKVLGVTHQRFAVKSHTWLPVDGGGLP